jgi:hypothetical protein
MSSFFGSCHFYLLGLKWYYDPRFNWNFYGQTSSSQPGYTSTYVQGGACLGVGSNPTTFGTLTSNFLSPVKFSNNGFDISAVWPRSLGGPQNYSCFLGGGIQPTTYYIRVQVLATNNIGNARCLGGYPFYYTNIGLLYYNMDTNSLLEVEKYAGGRSSNSASSAFQFVNRLDLQYGIFTPNCNCAITNLCQTYYGIYSPGSQNIYGYLDVGYAGALQIYAWDSFPKVMTLFLTSPRINSTSATLGTSIDFTSTNGGCRLCNLG